MTEVVQEARQRVHGLSKTQAREMPETTRLGRLVATGEISRVQYEAGSQYRDVVYRRDRAIGVRRVQPAGDLDRQAGFDGEESEQEAERSRKAVQAYQDCWQALYVDATHEDRYAASTVETVVLHDWNIPHFTPSLRVGLNHLARVLRIAEVGVDNSRKSASIGAHPYKSELRPQAVKA